MSSGLDVETAGVTTADAARRMDAMYRRQRRIYDATRKFYLLGRDRLLDGLAPPPGGTVLEVACGTGRNLIAAARHYPDARLYGFDISREMLAEAAASVTRAGLERRIVLAHGDAAVFSGAQTFGVAAFDRVFVSYAVSMMPPWRDALQAALEATAAGGELHVVDFGQQSGLPRWFRSGLNGWLGSFSVTPRADLQDEMQRLARARGCDLTFSSLYRDYARYGVIAERLRARVAQRAQD
jgi:S-adenosylmethionine-diacylgycerolhomoserine-N-methlytransferase